MISTQMICENLEGTQYRLMPNPDAGEDGFKGGAVLEWKDSNESKWHGYFFISPDCMNDLSEMFRRAKCMRDGDIPGPEGSEGSRLRGIINEAARRISEYTSDGDGGSPEELGAFVMDVLKNA